MAAVSAAFVQSSSWGIEIQNGVAVFAGENNAGKTFVTLTIPRPDGAPGTGRAVW